MKIKFLFLLRSVLQSYICFVVNTTHSFPVQLWLLPSSKLRLTVAGLDQST